MSPLSRPAAVVLAGAVTALALAGCGSGSSVSTATPTPSAAAGSPAAQPPADGGQHLDVDAFAALVATPAVVVLDVRTPEEFAAGHLPGAQLVDVQAPDFDTRVAALDKAATYAVYCRTGHRSGVALQRLAATGLTHASDLSGGITAWAAAGHPVTTTG